MNNDRQLAFYHAGKAEGIIANADTDVSANWPVTTGESKSDIIATAQVHATLAQVYAQLAMSTPDEKVED